MLKELVLLRKKYSNSLFQKCDNYFNGKPIISDIDLKLKKNMDYDWMLQSQSSKISLQLSGINKRIREFSKIPKHDKKMMNKFLELKKTLKEQEQQILLLQENHFKEISSEYIKIVTYLTKSLLSYADIDTYFQKMNLALTKSEKKFIYYCEHWKDEQLNYYVQINENSSVILKKSEEIFSELEAYFKDQQDFHKNIIVAKVINLSHYIENFKSSYPKVIHFKDDFLLHLDLKNKFSSITQNLDLKHSNSTNSIIIDKTEIEKELKDVMFIFYEIYHESKKVIKKIELEKRKFHRIAIPSKELKKKVLVQWLENDTNSTFFMFSRYLEDHELSEQN